MTTKMNLKDYTKALRDSALSERLREASKILASVVPAALERFEEQERATKLAAWSTELENWAKEVDRRDRRDL